MKPRKVILTIGTTSRDPVALLRGLRGSNIWGPARSKNDTVLTVIHVDQISVNVVRDEKKKGKKR